MNKHITTIFFDLFGVLLGIDQSVTTHYLAKLTNNSYIKTKEIAMGEPLMKLERKEINFEDYTIELKKLLKNGQLINNKDLQNIWMNTKIGEMPCTSLVDNLKQHYKLWIISNTTEEHINKLKLEFDFFNLFNGIITSETAKCHKPNPQIFKFAFKQANSDITNTLFIDDSYNNINSAKKLGLVSHHYTQYDKLIKFFKKYQII